MLHYLIGEPVSDWIEEKFWSAKGMKSILLMNLFTTEIESTTCNICFEGKKNKSFVLFVKVDIQGFMALYHILLMCFFYSLNLSNVSCAKAYLRLC